MRKMLTIKQANKILQQQQIHAVILKVEGRNSSYNVQFENGLFYCYANKNLYSLLLKLGVSVDCLADY